MTLARSALPSVLLLAVFAAVTWRETGALSKGSAAEVKR